MASSSTPSHSIGTRHESLYLPTGDLVLSALSTVEDHGVVLFRVHKSVMAHHSPIFRDMFAIPVPVEDCNESYDGAHMVHISDSAEDLEGLLRVFYDPTRLPHKCQEFDFAVVGILKLAIKYEIEPIRKHIIAQVNAAWPSTLEEWDASEKRFELMTENDVLSTGAFLPDPVLCMEIAKLAPQDVHVYRVAFYQLFRTPVHNNWTRGRPGSNVFRCARWDNLPSEYYSQLLRDWDTLRNFLTKMEKDFRPQTVGSLLCRSRSSCVSAYDKLWQEVYCEIYKHNDPLRTLSMQDRPGYNPPDELCYQCVNGFGGVLTGIRPLFWEGWKSGFQLAVPN